MLNNLSNKKKLYGLFIIFFLSFFACYQFAFKKTLNEFNKSLGIKNQSTNVVADSIAMELLFTKEERLNSLFKHFQVDTSEGSNKILSLVSESCTKYSIKLKEYRPYTTINKDSLNILTVMIVTEGPFSSLVSSVFDLETKNIAGKISSVDFKRYTDPTDKIQKLTCTLYIQNLLIINDHYVY